MLGSGEFAYPPYKLAEALDAAGHDVWFQTTTRSPVLVGGAIGSALSFEDNYFDGIPNFVYNLGAASPDRPPHQAPDPPPDPRYDRIVIGYETPRLPPQHRLAERIGARVCFF